MLEEYNRINWQDLPSTNTPRNATNLNKMDKGLKDVNSALLGNISAGNITVESITCKNLFNKENVILNYYLDYSTGEPTWDSNMCYCSDYIDTSVHKQWTLSNTTPIIFIFYKYDSNKTYLGYTVQNTSDTHYSQTFGSEVKYIRVATGKGAINTLQLEKGSTASNFIPYKKYGYNSQESMENIVVDDINCKNLFNISREGINERTSLSIIDNNNFTVTKTSGTANQPGFMSWLIDVEQNTNYTFNCSMSANGTYDQVSIWDADISQSIMADQKSFPFTFNTGNHSTISILFYVTETGIRNTFTNIQLEKGSTATDFVSYKKFGYSEDKSMGNIVVDGISSKNLFNFDNLTMSTGTIDYTNKTLSVNQYYNRSDVTLKQLCPDLKAGDVACLSMETTGLPWIYLHGSDTSWFTTSPQHTVTQAELDGYIAFYGQESQTGPWTISNIQIERGTQATSYTPHKEYGYTNGSKYTILGDMLIQYGTATVPANSDYYTISFPTSFADTNYSFTANGQFNQSADTTISYSGKTVSSINVYSRISGAISTGIQNISWIAIGKVGSTSANRSVTTRSVQETTEEEER